MDGGLVINEIVIASQQRMGNSPVRCVVSGNMVFCLWTPYSPFYSTRSALVFGTAGYCPPVLAPEVWPPRDMTKVAEQLVPWAGETRERLRRWGSSPENNRTYLN